MKKEGEGEKGGFKIVLKIRLFFMKNNFEGCSF